MFLRQALDRIHQFSADQLNGLSDLLCPELINQCLEDTGVATLRKRRLPMELMVWSIVGMSLYRHLSMSKVVSQLDILLPGCIFRSIPISHFGIAKIAIGMPEILPFSFLNQ